MSSLKNNDYIYSEVTLGKVNSNTQTKSLPTSEEMC